MMYFNAMYIVTHFFGGYQGSPDLFPSTSPRFSKVLYSVHVSPDGSTMHLGSSLQKLVEKAVMVAALIVEKKSQGRRRQIRICSMEVDAV